MQTVDLGANEQTPSIFKTTDFERAYDVLKARIKAVYRFDLINPAYLATVGNPLLLQGDRVSKFLLEYTKQAKDWKKAYTDKADYPKWRDAMLPKVGYPEEILERHFRYFREVGSSVPKSIREPWTYTPPKSKGLFSDGIDEMLSTVGPWLIGGLVLYGLAGGIGKGLVSRGK